MADSHGDPASIDAAAHILKRRGCDLLCHLGDVCDTARPESTKICLERLMAHGILAVRGNNEHTLLLNQSSSIPPAALDIIRAMPLTRQIGTALMAHSLPFVSGMGSRCMLETMTTTHIRSYFRDYPSKKLFRGHSHHPEIVRTNQAALIRDKLFPGKIYPLDHSESAIITIGALTDGMCLIWAPPEATIELVSLTDV